MIFCAATEIEFFIRIQFFYMNNARSPYVSTANHIQNTCFYELENERHIETHFIEYLFAWTLNPSLGLFMKHPELSKKYPNDIYFEQS